jgi:hypothetical protein
MTISFSVPIVSLAMIFLVLAVHYLTHNLLGVGRPFSLVLSLCTASAWLMLSLLSFFSANLRVLMGEPVLGGWRWLLGASALFLTLLFATRQLFFLRWQLAALLALSITTFWLLGFCIGSSILSFGRD